MTNKQSTQLLSQANSAHSRTHQLRNCIWSRDHDLVSWIWYYNL